MSQLSGKTALVSGGARGIGLAIAGALHEAGATVILADIDQVEAEKAAPKDWAGTPWRCRWTSLT